MRVWILFLAVLIWSCVQHQDFVLSDKALLPEGTAFNASTNTIYIGSIYKQKVIGIASDGKVKNVITPEQFEHFSPLGMEMDESSNILWVNAAVAPIVNHPPNTKNQTALLAFDPSRNLRLKTYVLETDETAMLNDLTVDTYGNVYATETFGGKIYLLQANSDSLTIFVNLQKYHHPNGITFDGINQLLFVATDEGILKIDIQSKGISLVKTADNIDATVIDGLAIYQNYFIGHQSTKVTKFYFNDDISLITKVETLDEGKAFDSSTTGEIGGDFYYYIVNSQLRSGVDRAKHKIKPLDSLKQIIIRKKKL